MSVVNNVDIVGHTIEFVFSVIFAFQVVQFYMHIKNVLGMGNIFVVLVVFLLGDSNEKE